mgnify:CR=1 FL=1
MDIMTCLDAVIKLKWYIKEETWTGLPKKKKFIEMKIESPAQMQSDNFFNFYSF